MDTASNGELERLTDLTFVAAAAGICFVLAIFFVMTPFFLESDVLSSLLLVGFFAATFGTFYFGRRAYRLEEDLREAYRREWRSR